MIIKKMWCQNISVHIYFKRYESNTRIDLSIKFVKTYKRFDWYD